VKLLDFGIARVDTLMREASTDSNMIIGSLQYLAPERFIDKSFRTASDVFGLGCTLYEVVAGERFYTKGVVRDIAGISMQPARYAKYLDGRLQAVRGRIPEDLEELIAWMLAYEQDKRPLAGELASMEQDTESLPGPALRTWCRDRIWEQAEYSSGPLEGRELIEELDIGEDPTRELPSSEEPTQTPRSPRTPAPTQRSSPTPRPTPMVIAGGRPPGSRQVGATPEPAPAKPAKNDKRESPPRRGTWILFLTAVTAAVVALTVLVAFRWSGGGSAALESGTVVVETTVPEGAETEPPAVALPEPEPKPTPVVQPAEIPPLPRDGFIEVKSKHPVTLKRGHDVFPPGVLPAGKYPLFVTTSAGPQQYNVLVPAGGRLSCTTNPFTCTETTPPP
jgi:serine/threonine-protein kinase